MAKKGTSNVRNDVVLRVIPGNDVRAERQPGGNVEQCLACYATDRRQRCGQWERLRGEFSQSLDFHPLPCFDDML